MSALSLSESVPDCIILKRKLASDDAELDEEEVWKARMSVACSSVAFEVNEESSEGDIVTDGARDVSGGITVYHCEVGWKTKCDLGLSDNFAGSWTMGMSSIDSSDFLKGDGFCEGAFLYLCISFREFPDKRGPLSARSSPLRNLETSFDNVG